MRIRRVEAQELKLIDEALKNYSESDFAVWVDAKGIYSIVLAGDVVFETSQISEIQDFFKKI